MASKDEEIAVASPDVASISVQAPSDMPGGYEFYADAGNGSTYKVRVPNGGVKAGTRFDAIIVSQATGGNTGSHGIPTGHWRDGLCDCCTLGACHVVCCMGFWCEMCLLGQVLARNKLSWIAAPVGRIDPCTFQFWFVMMILSLVLGNVGSIVQYSVGSYEEVTKYDSQGYKNVNLEYTGPAWAEVVSSVFSITSSIIGLLACTTTCRAREYLRQKYNIATEACGGCEDCCCAFWCAPCTICQMARHTADYNVHKAECCTTTGLRPDAPEIV